MADDTIKKTLGQIGYETYGDHPGPHGPWTTYDGRPMPTWEQLGSTPSGQHTQERWEVAVAAGASAMAAMNPQSELKVGTFRVEVDATEAESALELLGARVETLIAKLERLAPHLERLGAG